MSDQSEFIIKNSVLTKYNGPGGDVVIPEGVSIIGQSAFSYCRTLKSVIIPSGVTNIGIGAFRSCSNLENAIIPESVISINDWAFCDCTGLTSITIPPSVTSIGDSAFSGCTGLADADGFIVVAHVLFDYTGPGGAVVIPESMTSIGFEAFSDCSSLTSITIPKSVTSISDSAFSGCSSLTSITIPEGVTGIRNSAFRGCSSLTSITIPERVTGIGSKTFEQCSSLTSITIPGGVTCIGDSAFRGCSSLTSITIPEGVTCIGDSAFLGCSSLTSVMIPKSATSISGSVFRDCRSLTSITIPEGVTRIGDSAFERCSSLTSITIPEGVIGIGSEAFRDCRSLTSITIPESVTGIGRSAFSGCSSLTWATVKTSKARFGDYVFSDTGLCELVIPDKLKSLGKDPFGNSLPIGLISEIKSFYHSLTDGELKEYLFSGYGTKYWDRIEPQVQAEMFLTRQGKSLMEAYKKVINERSAEYIGIATSETLNGTASATECGRAAGFLTTLYEKVPAELLREIYDKLRTQKNSEKALKKVEEDVKLMEKIGKSVEVDVSLPEAAQKVMADLITDRLSAAEFEKRLRELHGIGYRDLPTISAEDERSLEPYVPAWLLTAHEKLVEQQWGNPQYEITWDKPGVRSEAAEIVALLDSRSWQDALVHIAAIASPMEGTSKKENLLYPVSRYASEETMFSLTSQAYKWGRQAQDVFHTACCYSDTRAAMLFAERHGKLDQYARMRGTDADTLRDTVLAEFGLDADGKKIYDLGGGTVTACLTDDLLLILTDDRTGKTVKSILAKNTDPEKAEAAKRDLTMLRKNIKSAAKRRSERLFEDFMEGRQTAAGKWRDLYLGNPVLNRVARLLVWEQDGRTFAVTADGFADSTGAPYTLTESPVRLAHPMELEAEELTRWQKYFTSHGLKQPFEQIWEPVIDQNTFLEDRYKGCRINPLYMKNQTRRGIDAEWSEGSYTERKHVRITGFTVTAADALWQPGDRVRYFEISTLVPQKWDRRANSVIAFLDRITVWDRVRKDDVSVMNLMDRFTLAQVSEMVAIAQEAQAVNVLALLMEYKNTHFADFDPMDEFTLE